MRIGLLHPHYLPTRSFHSPAFYLSQRPSLTFIGPAGYYPALLLTFLFPLTYARSALHCLVGAKLLNTLTNSAACTVAFSAISAIICLFFSLPRTLNQLSGLGTFSAVTMGIAVLLAIIFVGIQDHPFGYVEGQGPTVHVVAEKGTGFVLGACFYEMQCGSSII